MPISSNISNTLFNSKALKNFNLISTNLLQCANRLDSSKKITHTKRGNLTYY